MDTRQAIPPDALRVNANLFQTDLCRNPEAKMAFTAFIPVTWIPAIHASMTLSELGVRLVLIKKTKITSHHPSFLAQRLIYAHI
jgi:hypothetical protein